MDYLAPYLARLGDPESLNKPDIHQLKEDCLKDLRTHLVETANIIQARFEKVYICNDNKWYFLSIRDIFYYSFSIRMVCMYQSVLTLHICTIALPYFVFVHLYGKGNVRFAKEAK